jgi:hypothetical protein
MDVDVIQGLREIVLLSDEEFQRLVNRTNLENRKNELLAILVGAGIGLLVASPWELVQIFSWLQLYLTFVNIIMFGLLGWVIFASIVGTRLPVKLYRQPLDIDLFNLKPFEPIGRQSLALSLAFMGGIAISLLFSDVSSGIATVQFWVVYVILIIVAVLVFFLNMIPTHRVLSDTKNKEKNVVTDNLLAAYRELIQAKASGYDVQSAAEELNAWKISQDLIDDTKTWPYSIETLRNLLFTALIPGAAALVRLVAEIYFD